MAEGRVKAVSGQPFPDVDEDFLAQIIQLVGALRVACGQTEQPVLAGADNLPKRRLVSSLRRADQLGRKAGFFWRVHGHGGSPGMTGRCRPAQGSGSASGKPEGGEHGWLTDQWGRITYVTRGASTRLHPAGDSGPSIHSSPLFGPVVRQECLTSLRASPATPVPPFTTISPFSISPFSSPTLSHP